MVLVGRLVKITSGESSSFEHSFERVYGVSVSDVRWECVPEFGGRVTEGTRPHGRETGWGDDEAEGGGRSERPAGGMKGRGYGWP